MPILQHHFTSCRVGERSGFQVKAQSPGISPGVASVLQKLLTYRIPPQADKSDIDAHPVALRYHVIDPQTALLISSRSSGPDEHDRPGNWFAHSLVGSPQDFTPPIAYWESSFWVRGDEGDAADLPVLDDLDTEAPFDFATVWDFLAEGQRSVWFHALLCAVVDYAASQRRIVILDDTANVASWIAAVTHLLPPQFRPWLTFATCHHEPLTVPFMITGTLADFWRPTTDDYAAYFVLNVAEERVSEAPPSSFAAYVCEHLLAAAYEADVQKFFTLAQRRDPAPAIITRRLDHLANYYLVKERGSLAPDTPQALAALRDVTEHALAAGDLRAEDEDDLVGCVQLLNEALVNRQEPALLREYRHILGLLRSHVPGAAAAVQQEVCLVYAHFVLQNNPGFARELFNVLAEIYGREAIGQALSRPHVLTHFNEQLAADDAAQHILFWNILGPQLVVNGNNDHNNRAGLMTLIHKTLDVARARPARDVMTVPGEIEGLLQALLAGSEQKRNLLTEALTTYKERHPESYVFEWTYYMLVAALPMRERTNYRTTLRVVVPDLPLYELRRDLQTTSSTAEVLALLRAWFQMPQGGNLINEALGFAWELPFLDHEAAAAALLRDAGLAEALNQDWQGQLLNTALENAVIEPCDDTTLAMYRYFKDHPALLPPQRAVIGGVMAAAEQTLSFDEARITRARLENVPDDVYRRETGYLLERITLAPGGIENYLNLLRAAFVPPHYTAFWDLYWEHLGALLVEQQQVGAFIAVLGFWFDQSPRLYEIAPHLAPAFFTQLGGFFDQAQSLKGFNRIRKELDAALESQLWQPVVAPLVGKGRRGLFGGLR